AIGPAPVHHHGLAPATVTAHVHRAANRRDPAVFPTARYKPGFGGHAGHYVYANTAAPHLPPWILAFALGAVIALVWLAAASLRERCGATCSGSIQVPRRILDRT